MCHSALGGASSSRWGAGYCMLSMALRALPRPFQPSSLGTMNGAERDVPVVQAEDRFRSVDRAVKQLVKNAQEQIDKPKKRSWADHNEVVKDTTFAWKDVVDPASSSSRLRFIRNISGCLCPDPHDCSNTKGTNVYELEDYPRGLFVFSKAMCNEAQLLWARRAVEDYSTAEHTNLSNLTKLSESSDPQAKGAQGTLEAKEKLTSGISLWERSWQAKDGFSSFDKLRWSCLGYHYDWSNRMYQRDLKTVFPDELKNICQHIAAQVETDLVPEAAIVNFYPLGSCMGGHLDDAEHTLERPIISLSLGCGAVFMMGGRTKDVVPHALLLRSGDAVVMSGESRYCYHGVPAILSEGVEEALTEQVTEMHKLAHEKCDLWDESTKTVAAYLRSHRINMNVRQVRVDVGSDSWVDKAGTGYVKYAM